MIKEAGSQKSDAVAAEGAETAALGPSGATNEAASSSAGAESEPSAVVAQAVAQTRQEMPGILEVLKAGKFQVSR